MFPFSSSSLFLTLCTWLNVDFILPFQCCHEIWYLTGVLPSIKKNLWYAICSSNGKRVNCDVSRAPLLLMLEMNVGEKYEVLWENHGHVFSSYLHLNHFLLDNVVRLSQTCCLKISASFVFESSWNFETCFCSVDCNSIIHGQEWSFDSHKIWFWWCWIWPIVRWWAWWRIHRSLWKVDLLVSRDHSNLVPPQIGVGFLEIDMI
jgi:hypothetical protein